MSDARIDAPEASGARRGPRWLTGLVLGLAGLFYAYAVWNAVAHLVGCRTERADGHRLGDAALRRGLPRARVRRSRS